MSVGQIIDYFRNELKEKLKRPACRKRLMLWDEEHFSKKNLSCHYLINSNDFLYFWYQTSFDLCCVNNMDALNLKCVLDRYFYFLLDFENYFSIFLSHRVFATRKGVMDAVIDYNLDNNNIRAKVRRNKKIRQLFIDFVNRVNEWNYWKKNLLMHFIKINLGKGIYEQAQKNSIQKLVELVKNTEKIFDKGIQGNIV